MSTFVKQSVLRPRTGRHSEQAFIGEAGALEKVGAVTLAFGCCFERSWIWHRVDRVPTVPLVTVFWRVSVPG